MNPRERPGARGLVFPPSWQGERYTPAEEEAMERLQEAEGERAPADELPSPEDVFGILRGYEVDDDEDEAA